MNDSSPLILIQPLFFYSLPIPPFHISFFQINPFLTNVSIKFHALYILGVHIKANQMINYANQHTSF